MDGAIKILITLLLLLRSEAYLSGSERVEQMLARMSLEEKIGQVFAIPACPWRGGEVEHVQDLHILLDTHHIGSLLLQRGTSAEQVALIQALQGRSSTPLLCLQDGEWGVAMRLTDARPFPRNLTLGAIQNDALLYELGKEIGQQCRHVGAHLNLAPVVDVNSNPDNPIIGMRSFGSDPERVAQKGCQLMLGMQASGIVACAKHFPGHGDTSGDSHLDLPHVTHAELLPFQRLIDAGVGAVMTGHLYVEDLVERPGLPVTFSRRVVTDLLQSAMGFEGLVITDALNMQALAKHWPAHEIGLRALEAGHDILLYGDHIAPNIDQILRLEVPAAIAAIKQAILEGRLSQAELDQHVRKILGVKERLGLLDSTAFESEPVNTERGQALRQQLFAEALTCLSPSGGLSALQGRVALITWGEVPVLTRELDLPVFSLLEQALVDQISGFDALIISLKELSAQLPRFGLYDQILERLAVIQALNIPTTLVLFGTPYALRHLKQDFAILVAYEADTAAQKAAAEAIKAKRPCQGALPISLK